jgi:sec-independent protein translocase protein TatB
MKTVAFWVRKARKLASEFHSGIDQLVREAELEEAREAIRSASQMNLDRAVESTIDPTGEVNKALTPPNDGELDSAHESERPAPPPVIAEALREPESDPSAPAEAPPAPGQAKAEPA